MNCQYCHEEFSSKNSLKTHQLRAQYCLRLQGKEEEANKILENNKCGKCDANFSTKSTLKRHLLTCSSTTQITNTINNINNNTLNITLNIYGSTLSAITVEDIQKRLVPLLMQVVPNLPEMCRVAAGGLTNEKGNPLIAVTDASRNKFVMRYDDQDIPDIRGCKTCSIVRPPMIEASVNIGSEEALELADTLGDKKDKTLVETLSQELPSSLDVVCPKLKKDMEDSEQSMTRVMEKLKNAKNATKKKKDIQKAIEDDSKLNNFLDQCARAASGLYIHKKYGYVVEVIGDESYNIQWKKRPGSETNLDLDAADLKNLCDNGMRKHIASRYLTKITKIPE